MGLGWMLPLIASIGWLALSSVLINGLRTYPHSQFGMANIITTLRAAITMLLAGVIPYAEQLAAAEQQLWVWAMTAAVLLSLLLDGVDGYVARASNLVSAFGARYDMEIDALLALVVALLIWRMGEAGVWILGLGLMRYAFLAVAHFVPALQAALFPSQRRKVICVVQVGTLCAILAPVIEPPVSTYLGFIALALLSASFARDCHWLLRTEARTPSPT